jgi:hypothetical protein
VFSRDILENTDFESAQVVFVATQNHINVVLVQPKAPFNCKLVEQP